MCGRYVTGTDEHSWREWATLLELPTLTLPADSSAWAEPFGPTAQVPILRLAPEGPATPELVLARWGLMPSWMKQPYKQRPQYNLRSETAPKRFKKYLARRRCVLPAARFWVRRDADRERVAVELPDQPLFGLAGLWTEREIDGKPARSCTILTTEADAELGRLHERMPVVLVGADARRWLAADDGAAILGELSSATPPLRLTAA
ncbi:hypothetical protein ENSA5_43530 [Enhygromyxa salina]|uniref:Abasic site processing protein n=1 Tax=Enhygromyxa salina TaxID=215803 RepID=A0A2S9XK52_9BACT|nr:SOS response-associated peptidase family protein [Enhygromyxa salina]PRP93258.1 hypothetical protein ENSA5_43530 [Enhygromyxa salina]